MYIATNLGHFFLSEWIWSITWGMYHIPCNMILMLFFFKFFLRIGMVPTVLMVVSSHLVAFFLYSLFVVGGLIYGVGLQYGPEVGSSMVPTPLFACLFLGIIYAALQGLCFVVINRFYHFHVSWALVLAVVSNLLTALVVYLLLSFN